MKKKISFCHTFLKYFADHLYYLGEELRIYSHLLLSFAQLCVKWKKFHILLHFYMFLNTMMTPGQPKLCSSCLVLFLFWVVRFVLFLTVDVLRFRGLIILIEPKICINGRTWLWRLCSSTHVTLIHQIVSSAINVSFFIIILC